MGGGGGIGNIVDSVTDRISDAFGDATNSVREFARDPINTTFRNVGDIGTNVWNAGWVTIPGTNWQINLWAGGLGFTVPTLFPGSPFLRKKNTGEYQSGGSHPYRIDLNYYINDIKQDGALFDRIPASPTRQEIKTFLLQNPTYETEDICVDVQNSSLRLVFRDTYFDDNQGVINVEICYLGKTDDCNCDTLQSQTDIAVGFTRIDNNLKYPVSAHGMCYVGDKDRGLSTGGRCEENNLSEVELRLKNKYNMNYSTKVDDSLEKEELQKDRILDLAYEYNGTTWIRRQNLIESVYYHTGVGDHNNAIFFGGIHDTISSYTFSYDDELNSLPTAVFKDWDCENRENIIYSNKTLLGTTYPSNLVSSVCWETPSWSMSGNYIPACTTSTTSCLIFNDPSYAPNSSTSLNYINDPDYPDIKILDIYPDGAYKFNYCAAETVVATFPNTYSIQVSAYDLSANSFTVKAKASSISGENNGTFIGRLNIEQINFEFLDKFYIYPTDISGGTYITGPRWQFFIKEINSNQENVNILGVFRYGFEYFSTETNSNAIHAIDGYWALYFPDFRKIYEGAKAGTIVPALNSFIAVDATTFEISGASFFGTGSAKFTIDESTGVSVGIENATYTWNSSNESCGQDIASALNISTKIGTSENLRWGVPLWNKVFAQNAFFTADLAFNSKEEISDSNTGHILHEITNMSLECNSIMALANRRILINGTTQSQNHMYKALNDVYFKSSTKPINISYEPTIEGSQYSQTHNFYIIDNNCKFGFISPVTETAISGSVTSFGAACCSGTKTFPSTAFINPRSDSLSGKTSTFAYWDYVDGCLWRVEDVNVVSISSNITSISGFDVPQSSIFSCPETAVESLIVGSVIVTGSCSGNFTFPSSNFEVISSGPNILSNDGSHYVKVITHSIKDSCDNRVGIIFTTLNTVPAGVLTVEVSSCEMLCQETVSNSFSSAITIPNSGEGYSEYATSFIQEYRSDGKYKLCESWITSNDYNKSRLNNGIFVPSSWKRWMDGVGLGGDTPDYDTIFNVDTNSTYPTINWKEIGNWYVGQMAFGSPRKAVIVGGHKIDRSVGNTLFGSGLHAANTSKRVYVWDQTSVAPEDSYLKNYYARRFNTYTPNGTIPISSNQNLSNLNCIIFEGESDIIVERFGTVNFDGSSDTVSVTFDKEMPQEVGVNYVISLTCGDNVKMWWDNKTSVGFDIHSEIETWSGNVDWVATAIIKATEQDIIEKGNSSGYIFEK